jgi:hypothetical protein
MKRKLETIATLTPSTSTSSFSSSSSSYCHSSPSASSSSSITSERKRNSGRSGNPSQMVRELENCLTNISAMKSRHRQSHTSLKECPSLKFDLIKSQNYLQMFLQVSAPHYDFEPSIEITQPVVDLPSARGESQSQSSESHSDSDGGSSGSSSDLHNLDQNDADTALSSEYEMLSFNDILFTLSSSLTPSFSSSPSSSSHDSDETYQNIPATSSSPSSSPSIDKRL